MRACEVLSRVSEGMERVMNVCLVVSLHLFKACHFPRHFMGKSTCFFPITFLKCSSRLIISVEDNPRKAASPHPAAGGDGRRGKCHANIPNYCTTSFSMHS